MCTVGRHLQTILLEGRFRGGWIGPASSGVVGDVHGVGLPQLGYGDAITVGCDRQLPIFGCQPLPGGAELCRKRDLDPGRAAVIGIGEAESVAVGGGSHPDPTGAVLCDRNTGDNVVGQGQRADRAVTSIDHFGQTALGWHGARVGQISLICLAIVVVGSDNGGALHVVGILAEQQRLLGAPRR